MSQKKRKVQLHWMVLDDVLFDKSGRGKSCPCVIERDCVCVRAPTSPPSVCVYIIKLVNAKREQSDRREDPRENSKQKEQQQQPQL